MILKPDYSLTFDELAKHTYRTKEANIYKGRITLACHDFVSLKVYVADIFSVFSRQNISSVSSFVHCLRQH